MSELASGSRTRTAETHLQCPECDHVMTIRRKRSKMRGKNHIKHMWCPTCKEVTGHIEVKDDIFLPKWLREWENSNEYKEGSGKVFG